MEKLTLKHLAPYMPYGLETYWDYCLDSPNAPKRVIIMVGSNISYIIQSQFKPILRPLSDLTKQIEVCGKSFIPMYLLCKTQGFSMNKPDKYTYEFNEQFSKSAMIQDSDWIFRYLDGEKSFWLNGVGSYNKKHQKSSRQLECFQMLYEWHFDVFGLIENGLAIDINTIPDPQGNAQKPI